MKLPNASQAFIPEAKLIKYLLSKTHPVGESKARYFHSVGFDEGHADVLKEALLTVARSGEVNHVEQTGFGTKYIIETELSTPAGGRVHVRTVWIVEVGLENPRLVTAYPL